MVTVTEIIKSIFKKKHKGSTIGIDIGASSVKIVELDKVEERAILKNYGEIMLGPRAGIAAGQATALPPEKVAEAIRELLHEAGITPVHTVIAIPFNASLLSVVELPSVSTKELASMIPLEARRYIPVPVSEVLLDWWVLPRRKSEKAVVKGEGKDTTGKIEVIIAAIHNEVINKYETIMRDAQLVGDMSHFEIEIFSTLRAVVGRDLDPVLVVDVGSGSTKLALVDEGVVRGSHVVSLGGQDITLALSRSQNISFAEAEEIKVRVGMSGDEEGRDVAAVAELLLANILNESARFVQNYEQKRQTRIKKVILVGGGALLSGLQKVVEKTFPGVAVIVGDPFSRVDSPAFLEKTAKELSPRFAVAIGLALKGLEE